MAFRFRLCPNDTTAVLKELFNATPLKVPEASVQPMQVIAEKDGKTDKRGELRHLLSNPLATQVSLKEDKVSDVSLERTRSVDWDFGVKLLDGFFKGFNIPSAQVGTKLSNAREISLSFHNVQRRWLDKNELGSALRNQKLDLQHPAAGIFLGKDAWNMLLVTDVIISNGFAINKEGSGEGSFDAQLPTIQQIVSDAKANVKVRSGSKNSITFEGTEFLTFAFSCVKLDIDPNTGAIGVGMTVVTRSTENGVIQVEEPEPVSLDENEFEPGMLEWD